jgi:site-specific DNA-methyltransferase (cytosine-N4-specific)
METRPTRRQLTMPFLHTLEEYGPLQAKDTAAALATQIGLPQKLRDETTTLKSGEKVNTFRRTVRWLKQDLITAGLVANANGKWSLSAEGSDFLQKARPGIVISVFETAYGSALWAQAESAAGVITPGSVQLIFTSPEYPLATPKSYGNRSGDTYHNWLLVLASKWKSLLTEDGSLFLNLSQVYNKGEPTLSLYQERLLLALVEDAGYHYSGRWYWHNPAKIPSGEWVTRRRSRITNGIEEIYWLSKTPFPKADNRHVLKPYGRTMQRTLAKGGDPRKTRPGGHGGDRASFAVDHGGAIPQNLLVFPNSSSNDTYRRYCRAHDLPQHPARFPEGLPEFAIKLTTDPYQVVYDPLSGSNVTGKVAERLQRYWISSEQALAYIKGSIAHFSQHTSLLAA